jgi:diacylglycerol O-acyltransferase
VRERSARLEHLTSEDAEILGLEAGPIVGHTLKVVVAERPQVEGDLLTALRDRIAAGAGRVPRCRQKLLPVPLGLAPPAWAPDPDFDVRRHVRRGPPAGADRNEPLEATVARSMAKRLDRRHPLWTIELIEGLERDRVAYLLKIHHCMADGLASMRLASQLLWDSDPGEPLLVDGPLPRTEPEPSRRQLLASGVRERVRGLSATSTEAAKTLLSSRRRRAEESELARMPGTVRRELRATRARSPLDTSIGRSRTVAFVSWALDDLERVAHAHRATVNDLLLAAVAGGLCGWLHKRAQTIPDLRVKVPVSMHHGDEGPAASRQPRLVLLRRPPARRTRPAAAPRGRAP